MFYNFNRETAMEEYILMMHYKIFGGRGTEICLEFSVNNYQHTLADFGRMH